jgi:hypothetical protein
LFVSIRHLCLIGITDSYVDIRLLFCAVGGLATGLQSLFIISSGLWSPESENPVELRQDQGADPLGFLVFLAALLQAASLPEIWSIHAFISLVISFRFPLLWFSFLLLKEAVAYCFRNRLTVGTVIMAAIIGVSALSTCFVIILGFLGWADVCTFPVIWNG